MCEYNVYVDAPMVANSFDGNLIPFVLLQHDLKSTLKVLMYAPGTEAAEELIISILQSLNLPYYSPHVNSIDNAYAWHLLPMRSSSKILGPCEVQKSFDMNKSDLTSSSLGDKLIDALERTRGLLANNKEMYQHNQSVLFLGMDSPEIPIEEIVYGLQISFGQFPTEDSNESGESKLLERKGRAHLCPANDGGYGLLSVPIYAPSSIFSGVRWSNHLTAMSQLKALTDAGVDVSIGKLMFDVDDPHDVHQLAARLSKKKQTSDKICEKNDVLTNFTSGIGATIGNSNFGNDSICPRTSETLICLGLIK